MTETQITKQFENLNGLKENRDFFSNKRPYFYFNVHEDKALGSINQLFGRFTDFLPKVI